ncbi:hypothetical protein WQ57_23095 [Mesobacillus campisalis]|uniref:Tyr recombinase domain-containing protein n=1 Tax=Mesobacillus campisalis TaxID=1408103 RepID=A0A0M2SJI9_9BACI|nr:tyrosine-type recombinase/integrase [Mesobacillus campisalis]KKK34438.1 hypothetical protein WQ57_23095 [Mesobacillus campisalis]
MDHICFLKGQSVNKPKWNMEEINSFLKTAEEERSDLLYYFALSTGIRLQELLALTWNDVDTDKKKVTISKQLTLYNGGEGKVMHLRSVSHVLPISETLMEKLRVHRGQLKGEERDHSDQLGAGLNLVFPNQDGEYQKPGRVQMNLNRLTMKANVPRISFGDFRPIFTNLLVQGGADPITIHYLLRHNSMDTTIQYLDRLALLEIF